MKKITIKKLALVSAVAGALAISGCGGGGSTSSASNTSSVSGVAATGAPFVNATVTLTDASGTTRTATTGADGSYTIDVTGLTAPFVIKVSGIVGDTNQTLVSVQDVAPSAGQTVTVNVTPLTHALAAALSSNGDPLLLSPTQDKATIIANIANVKAFLRQALINVLTTASVDSSNFDPISTKFTPDHTGIDKVIDNLHVDVASDGTVSISNTGAAGAMVDDMGETTSLSSSQQQTSLTNALLTFKKGVTDFTHAPLVRVEATLADDSIADNARALLNQCFAVSAAQRGTIAGNNIATACQPLAAIVSNGYLNNGRTAAQEFDSLLSNSAMDNAVFMAPEIVRFYAADRALVRLGFRRTDGVLDSFATVAKNFGTASAPSWKLYGNQRHYNLFINAVADKRNELNPNATLPSSYNTGFNLYLDASAGSGPNISYAVVKGPGLPTNGVVLKPSTGTCSYLTIVDNNGNTGAAQRNSCASFFRMAGVAQSSTATYSPWGSSPNYAPTMVSDATLQAIKPFDAYVFDIVDNANNHTYLVDRLQAQPVTVARLPNIHYNVVADATKALLIPGTSSSFAGGEAASRSVGFRSRIQHQCDILASSSGQPVRVW
ncbi:MAG TPA: hypothetical protein VHV83_05815 [Armatimonadota bacterium]|nr:hypothetical protein [Armatimonadota bacterium]